MSLGSVLLTAALALWALPAQAVSDCGMGFRVGTSIVADGDVADWSGDAAVSVLTSASPCFEGLKDYAAGAPDPYPLRNVTVRTKRYQRSGHWYLGFLFEVPDSTNVVQLGEKIVVQFNRNIGGDDKLNLTEDHRFTLTHGWHSSGTTITDGTIQVEPPVTNAACADPGNPLGSGVDTEWANLSNGGITFGLRNNLAGGGYIAEIEVPVTFIDPGLGSNDLPRDFGVAVAVVNDFGKSSDGDFDCAPGAACEAAGASFPISLPETNLENAVGAPCDKGWVIPKQWGIGYLNNPPGMVTISRLPEYWRSDAIRVYTCDTEGYTYYPDRPCKVRVNGVLRNTGAVTQRKVAFLWAKHGTGDPEEYKSIGLVDQVVGAGSPASPVTTSVWSPLWSGMPQGEANHPCLRVYLFPANMDKADAEQLQSDQVVTHDQLAALAVKYHVEEQEWAQKNISRHDTAVNCPYESCEVGDAGRPRIQLGLMSEAVAADKPALMVVTPNREELAKGDIARYGRDQLVVKVRTVGTRVTKRPVKRGYVFVEEFGGVVQVFPLALLKESKGALPLVFDIANGSKDTMKVRIASDVYVPDGKLAVRVRLPRNVITIRPGSTTTIKASVGERRDGDGRGCEHRPFDPRRCKLGDCERDREHGGDEECRDWPEGRHDRFEPHFPDKLIPR
jgi:hypothetical protein